MAWSEYLDALSIKRAIAAFRLQRLREELWIDAREHRPQISVQACFEGVVISVVAGIDQFAQAINSALGLGLSGEQKFEGTAPEAERRLPKFSPWRSNPIGIDLRRLRTRIVHYSFEKSIDGAAGWVVEPGSSGSAE